MPNRFVSSDQAVRTAALAEEAAEVLVRIAVEHYDTAYIRLGISDSEQRLESALREAVASHARRGYPSMRPTTLQALRRTVRAAIEADQQRRSLSTRLAGDFTRQEND